MPFYNAEKTIEKSIRSALNQTESSFELLAIDDGSTDSSLSIVQKISLEDNRIKFFSCNHGGISVARNLALQYASGEYLYFLDADDIMEPTLLEKMCLAMEKNNAQIAFCRFKNVDENENDLFTLYESNLSKFASCLKDVQYLYIPKTGTTQSEMTDSLLWSLFRVLFRNDIVKSKKIRFELVPFAEDFLFLTQYLKHIKNGCLVDEVLYKYTLLKNSVATHSRGYKSDYDDVANLLLKRAKETLYGNSIYTRKRQREIYRIFALCLAYNRILNMFLADNPMSIYKKRRKSIIRWYNPTHLEELRYQIGEKRYMLLKCFYEKSYQDVYQLLKSN